MIHSLEMMLSLTFVCGIFAIWAAQIIKLPSILILLFVGFAVGPLFQYIQPDLLYGATLYPLISVSIGIILFEGGLSLKISDLREVGKPLARILSVSALITWILVAILSYFLLGLSLSLSILYGAMLIVTGPTVVSPLLQFIRPPRKLYALAHWEGIMIDPVGVLISTLVFEAIYVSENAPSDFFIWTLLIAIGKTIGLGFSIAYPLSFLYVFLARTSFLIEHLQPLVALAFAIFSFSLSNYFQSESGLFTITLFGLFLRNQKKISTEHIFSFNENLRTLLLGVLFITLSAKLTIHDIEAITFSGVLFVIALVVFVRPLSICIGLKGLSFSKKELLFMSAMAPRGIVAASVASIFANKLGEDASIFVPITFLVITATVIIYGVGTPILCRYIGLSKDNPQGVLFIGSNDVTRSLGESLQELGVTVCIVDTNYHEISKSNLRGLNAVMANALSEDMLGKIPFSEIGHVIVATPGVKSNYIISSHLKSFFSSSHIFQVSPLGSDAEMRMISSPLFIGVQYTFDYLNQYLSDPQQIKKTKITNEFTYQDFISLNPHNFTLCIQRKNGVLEFTKNNERLKNIEPGDVILSANIV